MTSETMLCPYCGRDKSRREFSDEHIWPRGLGGDFLPKDVWRLDACRSCNSLSGVFVDGAFIRSWFGKNELSFGGRRYLAGIGRPAAVPLDYLGSIVDPPPPKGHLADSWAGPCGAIIVHIRPENAEPIWDSYAGGDPRPNKAEPGRAYLALTSREEFWVSVSLASFSEHFEYGERYLVNAGPPADWPIKLPDRADPVQAQDLKLVDAIIDRARKGEFMQLRPTFDADLGKRMLAKLGLAVGCKILSAEFLTTPYAATLRAGFREVNREKRRAIPVRGVGFLEESPLDKAARVMAWPGGWTLIVKIVGEVLGLTVIAPSGRSMMVVISDEPALVSKVQPTYSDGMVWITVPLLREAVGPVPLPDYLAHQLGNISVTTLAELARKRGDIDKLPPCRSGAARP